MKQSTLIQRDICRLYKVSKLLSKDAGSYEFENAIHKNLSRAAHEVEKARDRLARLRNKAIDSERERDGAL